MKLLVTGRGGAGSWTCRGEQLGAALGATVKPFATMADAMACDLAIVVKRTPPDVIQALRRAGTPWVYDIVDAYPQPAASAWTQSQASRWVRAHLRDLQPAATIWPNERMRADCDVGRPGFVLPHHHRPGIRLNPVRERVQVVGYEGAPHYLGAWLDVARDLCTARGWRFEVNPRHLADLDIVIAMRGGEWSGYVQRHWKSNVKLANAHGSGTPFVGQQECGYLESATGAEYWAENAAELRVAFDWLEAQSTREQIRDRFVQAALPVDRAAERLAGWLRGL